MIDLKRSNFYKSLENAQIKTVGSRVWFGLLVTLTKSENPYLTYPVRGVLASCEQGTDLHISQSIFHILLEDGSLSAPVGVRDPVFTYDGGSIDSKVPVESGK